MADDPILTQVGTVTTDEDGNTITTGYAPDVHSVEPAGDVQIGPPVGGGIGVDDGA